MEKNIFILDLKSEIYAQEFSLSNVIFYPK